MFAFGSLLTASLYIYWDLHTRPFRSLQIAIKEAFPEVTPRVIGGVHKSHRPDNPKTLRVMLYVKFDPEAKESEARREELAQKVAELANLHHNVFAYDVLEIHLVQRVPESDDRHWSKAASPTEWGLHPPPNASSSPSI